MTGIILFCKLFFKVIGFCTIVSIPITLIMAVVFLIRDVFFDTERARKI